MTSKRRCGEKGAALLIYEVDEERPAEAPEAASIAHAYPYKNIKNHFKSIVTRRGRDQLEAQRIKKLSEMRAEWHFLQTKLAQKEDDTGTPEQVKSYIAAINGDKCRLLLDIRDSLQRLISCSELIIHINVIKEFISNSDRIIFKNAATSTDTTKLMSWLYSIESVDVASDFIVFDDEHENQGPITIHNNCINVSFDKTVKINDVANRLSLIADLIDADKSSFSGLIFSGESFRARHKSTMFSLIDKNFVANVIDDLAEAIDNDYLGISYKWMDKNNKLEELTRVGARNFITKHDVAVFYYKSYLPIELNHGANPGIKHYYDAVSISDMKAENPCLRISFPKNVPLSFIFTNFRSNHGYLKEMSLEEYFSNNCYYDENELKLDNINETHYALLYSVGLATPAEHNKRLILRRVCGRLLTRMGSGLGAFSISRCDPADEYTYSWGWELVDPRQQPPAIISADPRLTQFEPFVSLVAEACGLSDGNKVAPETVKASANAQAFGCFRLTDEYGFRVVYAKKYKEIDTLINAEKKKTPKKRLPRLVSLEMSLCENPAFLKQMLTQHGLFAGRYGSLSPDRQKNKGGIGTSGYAVGFPTTKRTKLSDVLGKSADTYLGEVVEHNTNDYVRHMIARDKNYYTAPARITSSILMEQLKHNEELVTQEWCHLVGHGDRGDDAPYNLVSGSYHANTEQLAIETGMRALGEVHRRILAVKVSAYTLPLKDVNDFRQNTWQKNKHLPPKTGVSTVNTTKNETFNDVTSRIYDFSTTTFLTIETLLEDKPYCRSIDDEFGFTGIEHKWKYREISANADDVEMALRYIGVIFSDPDFIADIIVYGRVFSYTHIANDILAKYPALRGMFYKIIIELMSNSVLMATDYYTRAAEITADSHASFKEQMLRVPANHAITSNILQVAMNRLVAIADYYKAHYSTEQSVAASFVRYVITDRQMKCKIFEHMIDAQREDFDTHQSIYLTLLTRYRIARYLDGRWTKACSGNGGADDVDIHSVFNANSALLNARFRGQPFFAGFIDFLLSERCKKVGAKANDDAPKQRIENIRSLISQVSGKDEAPTRGQIEIETEGARGNPDRRPRPRGDGTEEPPLRRGQTRPEEEETPSIPNQESGMARRNPDQRPRPRDDVIEEPPLRRNQTWSEEEEETPFIPNQEDGMAPGGDPQ